MPADEVAAPDLPGAPVAGRARRPTTSTRPTLGAGLVDAAPPGHAGLGRPDDPRPSHLRVHGGQSPVGRQAPEPGRPPGRRDAAARCRDRGGVRARPTTGSSPASPRYYNTRNWHYAYLTRADDGRAVLEVLSCRQRPAARAHPELTVDVGGVTGSACGSTFDGPGGAVRLPTSGGGWQRAAGRSWTPRSCPTSTPRVIVDGEPAAWGFTGAFLGLWVQDLGADGGYADFDQATYLEGTSEILLD